ncbi:MAG: hypothetical protein V2J89_07795 [Halieaceae bacterium]|nr:hypothetical protein [Halieaceae bacterium]
MRPVIQDSIPSVDDSRRLRVEAGLGPRTLEAASRALPNSLFAAQIRVDGQVIGMGRVIGDGGSFYQVVGIAVVPTL